MFEIPEGLDPALIPMAFLLGRWQGRGVVEYPTMEPVEFWNVLTIGVVPGQAVLHHTSETWLYVDGEVAPERGSQWESGFWRPGENIADVELVVAHAAGIVEVCYGRVRGVSVEVGSDAIMATATGAKATATTRTYGQVDGDLAYAYYLATPDQALTGHVGARLQRAE
jgi:hypothetical protein